METVMEVKARAQVWAEAQASKTQCPVCGKTVSMRTLRWKHRCTRKPTRLPTLDAEQAEKRQLELKQLAELARRARLRSQPAP